MRKRWDLLPLASEVFVNRAKLGGQIRAGEVIMSPPKSAGIGRGGIGFGRDVGVAGGLTLHI